jgi:hypothetical protein
MIYENEKNTLACIVITQPDSGFVRQKQFKTGITF